MYKYIKGIIDEIDLSYIVVECSGIGYQINTSQNTISNFEVGDSAKIYTRLIVREDDMSICGFNTKEELDLFVQLISVSKVGPKVAMSLLSTYDYKNVIAYIVSEDVSKISKASGLGKKTAERIILELKDKVDKSSAKFEQTQLSKDTKGDFESEALQALVSLGYTSAEGKDAISKFGNESLNTQDLIKLALKYLMK